MSSVPCWSYRNWVDHADTAISASSEVASLPVTNLAVRTISQPFRSQATSVQIDFDFGVERPLKVLFAQFLRTTDIDELDEVPEYDFNDTITWALSNVAPGGTDVYSITVDSHVSEGYGTHTYLLGNELSARHVRLSLNAVARSNAGINYLTLGRAWLGPLFTPGHNFAPGSDYQWDDDSTVTRAARSRAEHVDHGDNVRSFVLTLEAIENSERDALIEFERLTGVRQQFLFMRKNEGELSREVMLARQAQVTGLPQIHRAYSRKQFRLVESL